MFNEMYNFLPVSENLFTSGMPTADQLRDAPNQGIQLIINLAPHDVPDALAGEEALVKSLEIEYLNFPVNWSTPNRDGLDKFMDAMDLHGSKKILVHCEANFRATAFVTLYRILRQGWKEEDAFRAMHDVWDEDAYPVWKTFIDAALKDGRKFQK